LALIKEKLPQGFSVIHQTGSMDVESVRQEYNRIGIPAQIAAFFNSMAQVYGKASLVVSRAGATTIAELTALSLPMILIPFPFAADDHQRKNAEILVEKGAAKMVLEKDLSPESFSADLLLLMMDRRVRETMGRLSGSCAKPQAAEIIVDHCFALLADKG
jgi:UDP-N-acetylglucosamine--N-acetylmuramyl-(pentapeptide) pyrophosphoryl-undecaprenol N-acetylglucosamine transferase